MLGYLSEAFSLQMPTTFWKLGPNFPERGGGAVKVAQGEDAAEHQLESGRRLGMSGRVL